MLVILDPSDRCTCDACTSPLCELTSQLALCPWITPGQYPIFQKHRVGRQDHGHLQVDGISAPSNPLLVRIQVYLYRYLRPQTTPPWYRTTPWTTGLTHRTSLFFNPPTHLVMTRRGARKWFFLGDQAPKSAATTVLARSISL